MATPHVTGAVALLMAAFPAAPAADIIRVIRQSARHPDAARRPDNRWGHGVVHLQDAYRALKELHMPTD